MIQWLTTMPNPREARTAQNADSGQRGWRTHAVVAEDAETFGSLKERGATALCGLRPRHGFGMDLFIEEKCAHCVRAVAGLASSK